MIAYLLALLLAAAWVIWLLEIAWLATVLINAMGDVLIAVADHLNHTKEGS